MNRLGFQLPDFTRVAWAPSAREVWEPRISRVSNAFQEVERLAVLDGVKPAALQTLTPSEIVGASQWAAVNGIIMLPLEQQGEVESYSSSTPPYVSGAQFTYRVAFARPASVQMWLDAWRARDNEKLGHALGYPNCCREFFQRVWVDNGFIDTTWEMAIAGEHNRTNGGVIEISGAWESNILLRWLGARLVSHLPCSPDCKGSRVIGHSTFEVMKRRHTLHEESEWLQEMLNWPVEWSALHGIAEIKTPVCRIITRTDATAERLVVRRQGNQYPSEGATGITFPFTERRQPFIQITQEDNWTENGFSTAAMMRMAHNVILELLSQVAVQSVDQIIDLGCGNGALLKRASKSSRCSVIGVDTDESKLQKLVATTPKATVRAANIYDLDWSMDRCRVAMISVQRLLEDPRRAGQLIRDIEANCDYCIIYSYNGKIGPTNYWIASFDEIDSVWAPQAETNAVLYKIKHGQVISEL